MSVFCLRGKDAERFNAYDKRPLSEAEKVDLERCRKLYKTTKGDKEM